MENKSDSRLPELREAYKNLHTALGEEAFKQYAALLRSYFNGKVSKVKYDEDARKLLTTPEYLHLHNLFLLSLTCKTSILSPDELGAGSKQHSQENYLLNEELIRDQILVTAFDHGLDGANESITDIVIIAAQMFLKNIITAMLSRSRGYKIRENNFQHAIGLPAPNPWLRNTNNIIDTTQESNLNLNEEDQTFEPVIRDDLEVAEQQAAFNFACGSRNSTLSNRLTLRCLYETLLENPHIINNNSIQTIYLEKILSQLQSS